MRKSFKKAAACLLAASMAAANTGNAFAAKEEPYGPGYVNQGDSSSQESGPGSVAGPGESGNTNPPQTNQSGEGQNASGENQAGENQTGETQQQQPEEEKNTSPHVNITWTPGVNGQITNYMMTLQNLKGGIAYRTFVNHGGFLPWMADGSPSGGTEDSTYVEAIQIQLTGDAAKAYDVYYSSTVDGMGKMGYAVNGEVSGTSGLGHFITSIEVILVPKGSAAPVYEEARYITPETSRITIAENGTTYTGEDGSPYNGWLDYDWVRYYFVDGKAVTGWQYIDGLKFYFDSFGRLNQDVDALIGKQSNYILKVNKTLNCLTVYAKDGTNGYIIPVKAMRTSVGDDTPLGTFHTPEKYRWRLMVNDSYTQYATRIIAGKGFLMHSITYGSPDIYDLNTEGYNGLGVSRSLGCVRLTAANAKWVYDNCPLGTEITIYEDGVVPSPFFKPDLIPIPLDQKFDPTDPAIV